MSGGKGRAYIVFDYDEALRIFDAVGAMRAKTERDHCARCTYLWGKYEEIELELLEFFNAVDLHVYAKARREAREAHDGATGESSAG